MSWSFFIHFFVPKNAAVVLTHVWLECEDAGDIVEAICSQRVGGICRPSEADVLLILPENLRQRKAFWLAYKNKLCFIPFSHHLSVYYPVRCCMRTSGVKLFYAIILIFPLHFPTFPLLSYYICVCNWNDKGNFVEQLSSISSILLRPTVTGLTPLLYPRQQITLNLYFISTEEISEISWGPISPSRIHKIVVVVQNKSFRPL